MVKFLAGSDIDIDHLLPEQVPTYWDQALLVTRNPVIAAKFFNIYMKAFIKTLLGYDATGVNSEGGALELKATMDVLKLKVEACCTVICCFGLKVD